MGYVKVNLKIPEIKAFNEGVLMLVIEDSTYAQHVPIQLGMLHIDRALDLLSDKETTKLNTKRKQSKLASLLAGKMAQVGDILKKTFSLDKVGGTMKLTKTVEIPPFCTIHVHGITKVKGHDKRVNIIVEPRNNGYNPSVVAVPSYACLKPGSSKIKMSLRNLTSKSIMTKVKSIVAQLATANAVPSMLASKNPQESEENEDKNPGSPDKGQIKAQLTKEQLEKLFAKLDLSGIEDWSDEDHEEVWKLIKEFGFLFAQNDLDLGKTSIVKHTIKRLDYTPFKERYCRILPHQFEEVRKYLQEMLET